MSTVSKLQSKRGISLKLSHLPKRTVYIDIVNLPDPVKLGFCIRFFNHDEVELYFQITGEGAGWTFGTENLGALASGGNDFKHLDEFGSRAKPSGELEEDVTLILKAYTDAAYSDLKWTYTRAVHIVFIKSDDPSYTVDELDTFEVDLEGWASAGTAAQASDYVLSGSYSFKTYKQVSGSGTSDYCRLYYLKVFQDAVLLVNLGNQDAATPIAVFNKWLRLVVPLPKNVSITLKIERGDFMRGSYKVWDAAYKTIVTPDKDIVYAIVDMRLSGTYPATGGAIISYLWLDDFKIISK